MEEQKLHGWITPEYAIDMIRDMLRYLYKNNRDDFEYIRNYVKNYEMAAGICPYMITNVPNAT